MKQVTIQYDINMQVLVIYFCHVNEHQVEEHAFKKIIEWHDSLGTSLQDKKTLQVKTNKHDSTSNEKAKRIYAIKIAIIKRKQI